jgi:hypothetical protein
MPLKRTAGWASCELALSAVLALVAVDGVWSVTCSLSGAAVSSGAEQAPPSRQTMGSNTLVAMFEAFTATCLQWLKYLQTMRHCEKKVEHGSRDRVGTDFDIRLVCIAKKVGDRIERRTSGRFNLVEFEAALRDGWCR